MKNSTMYRPLYEADPQIAAAIGAPRAVRAVGAANGANPVPIVVPCRAMIISSSQ